MYSHWEQKGRVIYTDMGNDYDPCVCVSAIPTDTHTHTSQVAPVGNTGEQPLNSEK